MEAHDHTIRRTTKLELGLAIGLIVNAVGIGIFIGTVAALKDDVGDVIAEVRAIREQAPDLAVLKYRVDQLEKKP